jgi:exonuclease VII large subunit
MRNLRKGKRLKKAIAIQKLLPNNTNWIRRIVRDGLRRIDEVNEKEAARRKEQYHRWREKMDKEELQCKARELDKKEKQIEKELEKERKAKEAAENKHEEFSQKIYDHEKKNKLMPDVVIEDDGPTDQKRDVNWVYDNLSRLIITNDLGLEQLDMDVLETAPSNGAVAMAHYALNNRSNFFEKFVIKSLAKTETVEEVTEEQSQEETIDVDCDPTFEGLEKYIARHVED